MTTPLQKATELAKRAYPDLFAKSPAAARAKVWAESPELRDAHASQPTTAVVDDVEQPVYKGSEPFSKIDQAARQELPDLYRSSPSRARAEVAKLRPELQDAYHRAHAAS